MIEQHLERIADATELAAVAADLVQDGLLDFRARRLAQIDVDEAELRALLVERPRVDRLPQLLRC